MKSQRRAKGKGRSVPSPAGRKAEPGAHTRRAQPLASARATLIEAPTQLSRSSLVDKKKPIAAAAPPQKKRPPAPRAAPKKSPLKAKISPTSPPARNPALPLTRAQRRVLPTRSPVGAHAGPTPISPGGLRSTPSPAEAKGYRARKGIDLPSILLEGDNPPPPPVSGPGERYALAPTPLEPELPAIKVVAEARTTQGPAPVEQTPDLPPIRELPEAYGTERLFLAARDPHWLYAAWDLTAKQRDNYNALSRDGHLVVRTYLQQVGGTPESETHVHPGSKSWFIPVKSAGARYQAELGYQTRGGRW